MSILNREGSVLDHVGSRYVDIDRRQFTAEVLAQYASLAKEARKSGQLTVALGCINSMAKVGQVMS